MAVSLAPDQARITSYLDDELDAAERAEFEATLATDATLAAEVERMRRMRALLRNEAAAIAVDDPGPSAFAERWRAIEAELGPVTVLPAAAESKPAAVVVPIDAARRRRRTILGGAVAFAAAAAVAVVSLVPGTGPTRTTGGTIATTNGDPPTRVNGTEIVRVEFGKSSGTFWEQAEGGDRVAIVWIDDTMPGEVARP